MTSFNDLELKDDRIEGVDFDNVGEERAGYTPQIPEGTYRFKLPANVKDLWEVSETKKGQRVRLQFSATDPLLVTHAKDPALIGSAYTGSITNMERNRARRGEPDRLVSDLSMLLRNALKSTSKIAGQKELMAEINKYAGQEFQANVEWSAFCNTNRTRYIPTADGGNVEDPEGKAGCGANVYSRDIPRNDAGVKQESFQCGACGAALRAYANLVRFQPAQG